MIPALDTRGLLPPGIHLAEFAEVADAFGSTPLRRDQLANLESWMTTEMKAKADCIESIIIAGSLLSDNPAPNDLDCAIIFDETSPAGAALERWLFLEASRISRTYRIDVQPNEGTFFQFVGDKGARRHGCQATDLRGIVSIAGWFRDTERTRFIAMHADLMGGVLEVAK